MIDDDSLFLANFVADLLMHSVQVNVILNDLGPLYFSQVIQLGPFVTSFRKKVKEEGVKLVRILYCNLPKFGVWKQYMHLATNEVETTGQIMDTIFAGLTAARSLPTEADLVRLRTIILSQNLAGVSFSDTPPVAPLTGNEQQLLNYIEERAQSFHQLANSAATEEAKVEALQQARTIYRDGIAAFHTPSFDIDGDGESASSSGAQPAGPAIELGGWELRRVNLQYPNQLLPGFIKTLEDSRELNKRRFEQKKRVLQQKSLAGNNEAQSFVERLSLQENAIEILNRFFDVTVEHAKCTEVNVELTQLDELLRSLYEISVSIVVAGLISVGKSTFVNSLVGQGIAPDRNDTMTAIPIRYLNDATLDEPIMRVPFVDQLNNTVQALQQLIAEKGLDVVSAGLPKVHLQKLAAEIAGGVDFKDHYEGTESVREISTKIHDLFRLAISDVCPPSIAQLLPVNWGENLNKYLTVSYRFPELDAASGIVTLSIVDTPGIDEDGVNRLRFGKILEDSIKTSNFAVMVTAVDRYSALAMAPLKILFHNARTKYKIPAILVVTHDEGVAQGDRENFMANVTNMMTHTDEFGQTHKIFRRDEVFLVSAVKKLVGARMLNYIAKEHRMPNELDADPYSRRLSVDWVHNASFGVTLEDKLENFHDQTTNTLEDKSKRLIQTSNMNDPINRLLDSAVRKAIPLCVGTNLMKALLLVESFIEKLTAELKPLTEEQLKSAQSKIKMIKGKLEKERKTFSQGINEQANAVKARLVQEQTSILKTMEVLIDTGFPESSTADHLGSRIARHIQNLENPKVTQVATKRDPVEFSSPEELIQTYLDLMHAVKLGISDHLVATFERVPAELYGWSNKRRSEMETRVSTVAQAFSETFSMPPPKGGFPSLDQPLENQTQHIPHIEFGLQQRLRPSAEVEQRKPTNTRTGGWKQKLEALFDLEEEADGSAVRRRGESLSMAAELGEGTEIMRVNPMDLRQDLKAHTKQIVEELLRDLRPQITQLVKNILESSGKEAKNALNKLLRTIERKISEQDLKDGGGLTESKQALLAKLTSVREDIVRFQTTLPPQ